MEVQIKHKQYAYWLCHLPGIGNRTIERLLETCGGTPEKVYHASEEQWQKAVNARQLEGMKELTAGWNPVEEYHRMVEKGIVFLTREEKDYPSRLKNIPDAPYGIFYRGRLPKEERLAVAIIGARDCSPYGGYVAEQLGEYLGKQGVQIISGMARGIDGISQRAALEAGGYSLGILGSGVDVCYPIQNRPLYEKLVAEGGILSTHPPGIPAKAQHFPQRNRIVSGMADVVVVIEARNKSGTLITVDMALEQGKEVYVVPGRITDRLSDGCNSLMKQGAGIVVSPQDFFQEINSLWEENRPVKSEEACNRNPKPGAEQREKSPSALRGINLLPDLKAVYDALDFYPESVAQIAAKLGENYGHIQVNTILLRLCMEGLATQFGTGYFCRKTE